MVPDTSGFAAEHVAGIVLFPEVEELDFVGPWEVLTMARKAGLAIRPLLIGASPAAVRCAKGMRVLPDVSFEVCPKLDVIVVPGGQGTRSGVNDPALVAFIAAAASSCRWITSVCTGAALIGKAGLTEGKRITTHWNAMDFVAENALGATLVRNERVVIDGNVMTGAGVSAGIDMALTLVGHLFGPNAALGVQKGMEYYPEPPFGGAHPVEKASA